MFTIFSDSYGRALKHFLPLAISLGRNRRSNDRYYVFKWQKAPPLQLFTGSILSYARCPIDIETMNDEMLL